MSGSNGLCFTAPVSQLSSLSTSIHNLVQSAFEGAPTCVYLEAANMGTFYRFCQFVYTSTYNDFTAPEIVDHANCTTKREPFPAANRIQTADEIGKRRVFLGASSRSSLFGTSSQSFLSDTTRDSKRYESSQQESQVQHGVKLPYSIVSYRDTMRRSAGPLIPVKRRREESSDGSFDRCLSFRSHTISMFLQKHGCANLWQTSPDNRCRSITNVLIGHAKIWQFAEKYAITALKDAACSRLTRELASWTINDSTFIADFGRLVRHSYHESGAGGNNLQLLITQFASCVLEDVKDLEGWAEQMGEVPAFRNDLGLTLAEIHCAYMGS